MGRLVDWFRSRGKGLRVTLQVSGGVLLFLLLVGVSAEYTSRPSFCTTCHYMKPYYDSWIAAPAHSQVSCVKCHFPPGVAGTVRGKMEGLVQVVNYLSSSYTRRKPWAEIEDASCLQSGCHETRLLSGTVGFKGVAFDHTVHLEDMRRGKQLRCTSCHSQIVQGDHITVTETSCFLCHFKKSQHEFDPIEFARASDCSTCHRWDSTLVSEPTEISNFHENVIDRGLACNQCHAKTVVGDGFVPHETCFGCHSDQERLSKVDQTEFLHETHIWDHKIECIQCHLQIQHKIQRVSAQDELDCGTCHRGTHREQVMLFTGDIGSGESAPSAMFAAGLDCAGCHVFHEDLVPTAEERVAQPTSCENCHGTGYNRLLRLWKRSADEKLTELSSFIRTVDGAVRRKGQSALTSATPYLDEARTLQHIVQIGKPVHNVTFYDRLIRSGYDALEKAAGVARISVELPEHKATPVPGQCANCHTGIETIATSFEGRSFSHEVHVAGQQVTCKTCHSNAVRHGQTILSPASCNNCHHKAPPAEVSCESCHEEAAAVYTGSFMGRDVPDYMAEEDVECIDCHVPKDRVERPTSAVCLDCHDEGYDADADEWKRDIATLTGEVRALLATARNANGDQTEYASVEKMLRDLESGAAGGVHNYELTSEILKEARDELRTAVGPLPTTAPEAPERPKEVPEEPKVDGPVTEPPPTVEEPEIFVAAEKMPELIGGLAGVQASITYPRAAERAGVEGRVIVQFVVNEEGEVTDPVVLQGIGSGCDEEAVRAVSQARFTPGTQRGRPVKVKMTLPILFTLE